MPNVLLPDSLFFNGSIGGGGITPSTTFTDFDFGGAEVVDTPSDGDMDTTDYYFLSHFLYSGYTIEINGNDYAVFHDGFGTFYVPYDPSIDDLSSLNGTAVSQPFTNAGENAVVVNCFLSGTGIATPAGEVPVEALTIGDKVLNSAGEEVAVKWVAQQSVMTMFNPAERVLPVRFAAGSLGNGLPHSDLTVTADHGMLVDGVICHAGALVNGTTITRVPLSEMGKTFTVYHIETDEHEIILANGAPAETFIDNVSRSTFDNFAEFEALYGNVPEMEELPYPRAMSARQVPTHIVRKIAAAKAA